MGEWISEVGPSFGFTVETTEHLYTARSPYQQIDIYQTAHCGKLMLLDGIIQFTEYDEFAYQEMLAHLREFEADHESFRFSGVTVLAEPHLFTSANPRRPKNLVFAWSDKTFGPGLDNDRIMRATLQKLSAFGAELGSTPFTVAMPDFYEELVQEGKLSCGSVADFSAAAPKIMIRNAGNKPTEAVEVVRNELNAAKPGSLLVSITLAEHTSVTAGSLRRRNWADFIRSLDYAIGQWKQYPAFDGVVLGPFSRIETLHQEK